MVNYENGKIYKIESHSGDMIYIGSTTKKYLSQRMDTHRNNYKCWKNGKYHFVTSFTIFNEYGVQNCIIALLELFPCESKDELVSKEAYYIRKLDCVNKVIPDRTMNEWREDNKDKIKEVKKQYYEDNKEKYKDYYDKNKDEISERHKEKIICGCGGCFRKSDKTRHEKTNKHQNYLKSIQLLRQG